MTSAGTSDTPGDDLSADALRAALGERALRFYPAALSTEADALAWARAGAAEGAVVVAEYQASPRGRSGRPWQIRSDEDLGFSLVLRPRLPAEREGWLYTVAVSGLADVLDGEATIEWPDAVRDRGSTQAGAVGVHVEVGTDGIEWAVATVHATGAGPDRPRVLARIIEAIEGRYSSDAESVLADYRPRCATLGREVRARLVPLRPGGPAVAGQAVEVLIDGALVIETEGGSRVAVRPQSLGLLEDVHR